MGVRFGAQEHGRTKERAGIELRYPPAAGRYGQSVLDGSGDEGFRCFDRPAIDHRADLAGVVERIADRQAFGDLDDSPFDLVGNRLLDHQS